MKAEKRSEILLETINPSDLTPSEIQELADKLSDAVADYRFAIAYEDQHGAGVSWHEVIHLWVENADIIKGGAFGFALEHVYQFMRERFKRPSGELRPKSITVNDVRNGKEILSIVIESIDSEPAETEVTVRIRPVPKKRPHEDDATRSLDN